MKKKPKGLSPCKFSLNIHFSIIFLYIFLSLTFTSLSAKGNLKSGLINAKLISGEVLYLLPEKSWTALLQNKVFLPSGSIIKTTIGKAILVFEDEGEIRVGENTIVKISIDEKENVLNIKTSGEIFVSIKKKNPGKIKIETPTALAAIAGSKIKIEVTKNLLTRTASIEGMIEVQSTYLLKGRVIKIDEDEKYILLDTGTGVKKILISRDTIAAQKKPQSATMGVSIGDYISIYGNTSQNGDVNAALILFVGINIGYNYLPESQQMQWIQSTATVEIVQAPIVVTPGNGTFVGPGSAPSQPAPAPPSMVIPDVGALPGPGQVYTAGAADAAASTGGTTGISTPGAITSLPPPPLISPEVIIGGGIFSIH